MNFCIKNKILAFYILFYIIYIFQLLDIEIFGSFSQIYKILVRKKDKKKLVNLSLNKIFVNIILKFEKKPYLQNNSFYLNNYLFNFL